MDDVIVARALHVLGVVIWIGGAGMATMVILPAVRRGDLGADRLAAFQAIKRRFVWIARSAVIVVGLSGLFMVARLDLWDRFLDSSFWWMHTMVIVWLLFAFVLFIGEPLVLHRIFPHWAKRDPETAFALLHQMHWILLLLSLFAIAGAVAGSHG